MSHPETAKRVLGYMNNIWLYTISKGYCKNNIVSNIYRKSIISKHTPTHYAKITDTVILKELIDAINDYSGNISIRNALRFILLLPLRVGTLIKLKWEYVDFKSNTLRVSRKLMKVKDKKNARGLGLC